MTRAALACLLLWARLASAQHGEGAEIRVQEIVPKIVDGNLTVSAAFQNLFSRRIVGTIQSGLPALVQIEVKLSDSANKNILGKQISRSISYNIWDERYAITGEDSAKLLTDFEAVKRVGSRLDSLVLLPKTILSTSVRYQVQIRVAIVPISSNQGAKITDWLLDPNQTEEGFASEDRSSGFKLNLSRLISFFVGDRKRSRYSSQWSSSGRFSIQELE